MGYYDRTESKEADRLGWRFKAGSECLPAPRQSEARVCAARGSDREETPGCETSQGFGGAGVLEIVAGHEGNAYRGIYTVRFEGRVYVLHVFQKKYKHGIATPPADAPLGDTRYVHWLQRKGVRASDHERTTPTCLIRFSTGRFSTRPMRAPPITGIWTRAGSRRDRSLTAVVGISDRSSARSKPSRQSSG